MFYPILLLCVSAVAAGSVRQGSRTLNDVLGSDIVFINISGIPDLEQKNQETLLKTRKFIKKFNPEHREAIAKFIAKSFSLFGEGVAYILSNTNGANLEDVVELANLLASSLFSNVEDPYLQALGNLLRRAAKIGDEEVYEMVGIWANNSVETKNPLDPEACLIPVNFYEPVTIFAGFVEVLHELIPSVKSTGLAGKFNKKVFEYGNVDGYDIFPGCQRDEPFNPSGGDDVSTTTSTANPADANSTDAPTTPQPELRIPFSFEEYKRLKRSIFSF